MSKKIKGKEWYSIVAPELFSNKVLGQTPVDDQKKLIWRKVETPLINLTNDMNKYYFKVNFRIINIKDKNANTEFSGLECLRDYVSRMIRHGIDRIDTVQKLTTKDDKKIIVKSVLVTNRKVKRGTEKSINDFVKNNIKKIVESNKLDLFLTKVIDDSVKRQVMKEGSKIYPIRNFEFRKIEVPTNQI
ncbi:MAG: hypothetical protein J4428_02160 [Candidatus Aenigmarchaeota archaeon]|nr:hypothetical protein [Candidatus Aenigmarchaeota archaeon]